MPGADDPDPHLKPSLRAILVAGTTADLESLFRSRAADRRPEAVAESRIVVPRHFRHELAQVGGAVAGDRQMAAWDDSGMAGPGALEHASSGWESLRAAEWEQARVAFENELAGGETPEALDGLGRALWWLSDVPGAIEAWKRAYASPGTPTPYVR